MLGYSKEELVGFFFTDITHPVDVDASVDHHLKLTTGELDNYQFEKRYIHKQGNEVWGLLSASLVRDKDGVPLYSVGQIQDIAERKRAEKALQTIAEGVSGAVGDIFFNFVVDYLAEALEVEYAFVGELIPEKKEIRTIAVHGQGKTMENFEYDLTGTPCENVVGKQFCIYERDLQKRFPDDQLLVDMGVESYAGGPLFSSDGRSVGIIVVLSNKPFKHIALAESLLSILGIRCATEFERKQAEQAILESNVELHNLTAKLHAIREEERTTISREIHDELGQALTGLRMDMGWLLNELPGSRKLQKRVQQSQILVDKTIDTIRRISHGLRPAMLDDLGLVPTIEDHMCDFKAHTNYDYDLILDVDNIGMEKERDTVLFRILQETLTNIMRHAHANYVKVVLQQQDDKLMLTVEDNGIGINEEDISSKNSIGLIGMRERALSAGGEIYFRRGEHVGTCVNLIVPTNFDRA
jgi:PAS domain S-box-containing protein